MRSALLGVAPLMLLAAAPAPADPLLSELIAGAKATPDKGVAFERTLVVTEDGKSKTFVDRYDPLRTQPWTLVSVDGRAPASSDIGDWKKRTKNGPPAYARVALLLAQAKPVDATHYRVHPLPKGFINPGAIGDHLTADLTVDRSGPRPFISESRFYAVTPFRMMLIAKIDKFEAHSRYRLGADGQPRIAEQNTLIAGSAPMMAGTQTVNATFSPLR